MSSIALLLLNRTVLICAPAPSDRRSDVRLPLSIAFFVRFRDEAMAPIMLVVRAFLCFQLVMACLPYPRGAPARVSGYMLNMITEPSSIHLRVEGSLIRVLVATTDKGALFTDGHRRRTSETRCPKSPAPDDIHGEEEGSGVIIAYSMSHGGRSDLQKSQNLDAIGWKLELGLISSSTASPAGAAAKASPSIPITFPDTYLDISSFHSM